MISVEEATRIIFQTIKDFGIESVSLDAAVGRILREDLYADRDFPPYDRVTMDGIAMDSSAFDTTHKTFRIAGVAAAGAPQMKLRNPAECLEVMTGAILPEGTDSVVRYEDLSIENEQASINLPQIKARQNVHEKGSDKLAGSLVVKSGIKISPAEIGVAATIGKAKIKVSRLPRSIIISTGDELVRVDESPLPYQIRRSNVHRLLATLKTYNIHADTAHLADDLDEVTDRLRAILEDYEVVIISGGVSKGKFDYLPEALENIGVEKLFHKIRQRPGKPFWFGQSPHGARIFALPGNPVSSFMCTQIYFVDWLRQSLGLPAQQRPYGVLQEDLHFKPDLTYFAQVKVGYNDKGQILANPVIGNGSGDLANLVDADAFIRIPRGKDYFEKGTVYPLYFFR
ncbi:MAG: molybdopterin molybdotransferase [Saprospiraceae bacterium]|jgi:molybdopterin molybdotransferase